MIKTWESYARQYRNLASRLIGEELASFKNFEQEEISSLSEESNKVFQNLISNMTKDQEFPKIFIVRHCIELELKIIGMIYSVFKNTPIANVSEKGHDIKTTWDSNRQFLTEILKADGMSEINLKKYFKDIGDYIKEQNDWDINSIALRYPTNFNGQLFELDTLSQTRLEKLEACFEAVGQILERTISLIKVNSFELNDTQKQSLINNAILDI